MNSDATKMNSSAVEFHNTLAAKWDDGYLSPIFSCRLAVIRDLLPSASGLWLDAGCGTGTIARWMSSIYGCDVEAIDGSVAMVAEAKRRGTKAQAGSVEQLPYVTNSLSGIVCSSVLEYLDDPCVALREFSRVLKPQGLLLVSVPRLRTHTLMRLVYYATLGRWYSASRYSKHSYSPSSFGATLTRCGFVEEGHRCFSRLDLPLGMSLNVGGTLTMFRARVVKS
jgi:SAM-dependent methyltransferase